MRMNFDLIRKGILAAVLISFPALLYAGSAEDLLAKGEKLFFSYNEDLSRIQESMKIFEEAFQQDPKDIKPLLLLSRAWLTYGDDIPQNKEEREGAYLKGKEWAKKALKIDDKSAQAHFWYFANMGRIQQLKNVFNNIIAIAEIRKHILKAYELDPKEVMIVDGLGAFYCELPTLFGGSLKKAENYQRKAIAMDPNYSLAYCDLAETLFRQERYTDALGTAKKVFTIEHPTYYADWAIWDKAVAEKLIKEIEEEMAKKAAH